MGRRKGFNDAARENSAIVVHPRPEQPPSQAYNLSFNPKRNLSSAGFLSAGPEKPATKVSPSTEPGDEAASAHAARARSGFAFADSLNAAADVLQADEAERDVEVEMLDIMEIDRKLDAMDGDAGGRGGDRRKVMFAS